TNPTFEGVVKKLRFRALVIETTDRCNARCAMCYQAAGPRGSDLRGDSHLALPVVLRVIDEAAKLPDLGSRFHVSGGESFIHYDEVLPIFRRAKSQGFVEIGATTNGFWAINPSIAEQRCTELAEAGANYLEISIDHWHLPFISLRRVSTLLRAAR